MQFKRIKRPVSGVLLLDKPVGYSSNQALQCAKRLFQAAKAGHTGNLDPFATGLLPLCFGEATKFSQTLLDADKIYRATLKLGATTSTGDTEGEITSTAPVKVLQQDIQRVLQAFTGEIAQTPPMHSALKHQGKPLYEYARAGVEIERKSRNVHIYALQLDHFEGDQVVITVSCSKGTYIRVLAEDIGRTLGCGAHLTGLRRLATGGFLLEQAITLDKLEALNATDRDQRLLPVDALLKDLPQVELDDNSAHYFQQGQPIWKSGSPDTTGLLRVYQSSGRFLGLGEMQDGRIAPKRLLVT